MSLEKQSARGMRFRQWCEEEGGLFETLDELKAKYIANMIATDVMKTEEVRSIHMAISVLNDVKQKLRGVIGTGNQADKDLKEQSDLTERVKSE